MNAIAATTTPKRRRSRKIPEALIYEIVDGRPVYYKGYKDVLNGKLNLEAVMSESSLQAWLKARLSGLLFAALESKGYDILTGELGLILGKDSRRGADLAVFRSENLVLDAHYAKIPPELIIEIDIQADLEEQSEMEYVLRKIEDYLGFGVKKVIWIFTTNRVVMTATAQKPWLTLGWDADIETIGGVTFSLNKILAGKKIG